MWRIRIPQQSNYFLLMFVFHGLLFVFRNLQKHIFIEHVFIRSFCYIISLNRLRDTLDISVFDKSEDYFLLRIFLLNLEFAILLVQNINEIEYEFVLSVFTDDNRDRPLDKALDYTIGLILLFYLRTFTKELRVAIHICKGYYLFFKISLLRLNLPDLILCLIIFFLTT